MTCAVKCPFRSYSYCRTRTAAHAFCVRPDTGVTGHSQEKSSCTTPAFLSLAQLCLCPFKKIKGQASITALLFPLQLYCVEVNKQICYHTFCGLGTVSNLKQLFYEQQPIYTRKVCKRWQTKVKHLKSAVLKSEIHRPQQELQGFCPSGKWI